MLAKSASAVTARANAAGAQQLGTLPSTKTANSRRLAAVSAHRLDPVTGAVEPAAPFSPSAAQQGSCSVGIARAFTASAASAALLLASCNPLLAEELPSESMSKATVSVSSILPNEDHQVMLAAAVKPAPSLVASAPTSDADAVTSSSKPLGEVTAKSSAPAVAVVAIAVKKDAAAPALAGEAVPTTKAAAAAVLADVSPGQTGAAVQRSGGSPVTPVPKPAAVLPLATLPAPAPAADKADVPEPAKPLAVAGIAEKKAEAPSSATVSKAEVAVLQPSEKKPEAPAASASKPEFAVVLPAAEKKADPVVSAAAVPQPAAVVAMATELASDAAPPPAAAAPAESTKPSAPAADTVKPAVAAAAVIVVPAEKKAEAPAPAPAAVKPAEAPKPAALPAAAEAPKLSAELAAAVAPKAEVAAPVPAAKAEATEKKPELAPAAKPVAADAPKPAVAPPAAPAEVAVPKPPAADAPRPAATPAPAPPPPPPPPPPAPAAVVAAPQAAPASKPAPAPSPAPAPAPAAAATAPKPAPTPAPAAAAPAASSSSAPQVVITLPPAPGDDASLEQLVTALVENDQFIALLVNNEAFLDRVAGDDRVPELLQKRRAEGSDMKARQELAQRLAKRASLLKALEGRGQDAVMAVADAARVVTDASDEAEQRQVRVLGLETAMELLEDSEELMMAVEGKAGQEPDFSGKRKFKAMESFVAATEARIESRMEGRGQAVGDAVKDLFNSSGPNAKGRARSDNPADTTSPAGKAYESMVLAFADLQRAYGIAFVEAGQSVSTKVSGLGQAAAQGINRTRDAATDKVAAAAKKAAAEKQERDARKAAAIAAAGKEGSAMSDAQRSAVIEVAAASGATAGAYLLWNQLNTKAQAPAQDQDPKSGKK